MRRSADNLRRELFFHNGSIWHADSFRVIYHQLMQDPRPFVVLHQQTLDGLREYNRLVELAGEYIASTRDKRAAKILECLVYDDSQALWRSFTVAIARDHSYNERNFQIVALMWECMEAARDAASNP